MYDLKFKKIPGPIPSSEGRSLRYCLLRVLNPYRDLGRSENSDPVMKNRSPSFSLSSLPKVSPRAKIG